MHAAEQPAPSGQLDVAANWHREFQAAFITWTGQSAFAVQDFYFGPDIDQAPSHDDRALRAWYDLHKIMFVMRKFEVYFQNIPPAKYPAFAQKGYFSTYEDARNAWSTSLEQLDQEQENVAVIPLHQHLLNALRDQLHQHAFREGTTPVDWPAFYRQFWSGNIDDAYAREEERWLQDTLSIDPHAAQADETAQTRTPLSAYDREKLIAAQLHLRLMYPMLTEETMPESDAIDRIQDLELLLPYTALFIRRKQWHTLIIWLRRLLPMMSDAPDAMIEPFAHAYAAAANALDIHEEQKDAMRTLLPRSFAQYADCLRQSEAWRDWIDLHLSYRVSPQLINPDPLRQIRACDASLLLPLYHQAIERAIGLRSKVGYRQAMEMLQILRTLYEDAGQTVRWQQYQSLLTDKYMRLKAFQHELQQVLDIPPADEEVQQ